MQFTPQLTPTWLDISVSVLHWLEGRGVCAQTTCSRRPIFMHIPAAEEDIQSRNHLQIQWQSLCAWGLSVCLSVSSLWHLHDPPVELQPIFPRRDGDVGRHLPRHLWSCPRRLAAQVVCEPDWLARGFVHLVLSWQDDEVLCVEMRW